MGKAESPDSSSQKNTIDQFVDSDSAPDDWTNNQEIDRLRKSAYFVHGNYFQIADLGPNIPRNGLVRVDTNSSDDGTEEYQVKGEILRRIHNYVSSVYSYNMQVLDHINEKTHDRKYTKRDLLPGPDIPKHKIPKYIQLNAFLHGLRNDIQHGEYHCLTVEEVDETDDGASHHHVKFLKNRFNPRPTGGLKNSGDYLRYSSSLEREYPLTYICNFHQEFNQFETDLEQWCNRMRR